MGTNFPEPVVKVAIGGPEVPARRAVAVTAGPAELLRPGSDLVRLVGGFAHVDLLVASDTARVDAVAIPLVGGADGENDAADEQAGADLRANAARLGLTGLQVHRLGLPSVLPATAADDLVAALSELIGFDPEPGLYCLAPVEPVATAITRATRRIAQVYAIPLIRYTCPDLAVVSTD